MQRVQECKCGVSPSSRNTYITRFSKSLLIEVHKQQGPWLHTRPALDHGRIFAKWIGGKTPPYGMWKDTEGGIARQLPHPPMPPKYGPPWTDPYYFCRDGVYGRRRTQLETKTGKNSTNITSRVVQKPNLISLLR